MLGRRPFWLPSRCQCRRKKTWWSCGSPNFLQARYHIFDCHPDLQLFPEVWKISIQTKRDNTFNRVLFNRWDPWVPRTRWRHGQRWAPSWPLSASRPCVPTTGCVLSPPPSQRWAGIEELNSIIIDSVIQKLVKKLNRERKRNKVNYIYLIVNRELVMLQGSV